MCSCVVSISMLNAFVGDCDVNRNISREQTIVCKRTRVVALSPIHKVEPRL